MKTNTANSILLLCLFFFVFGCNRGPKMPEGMPKPIKGVEVTVMQEGTPLADASVTFTAVDGSNIKWFIRGQTDSNGIAKMMTYGKFEGAPIGKYKVVITKREETPSKLTVPGDDDPNKVAAYQDALEKESRPMYDLVDPAFSSSKKTPAEIEIGNASLKHTIDVGKAVRIERK